MNNRQIKRFWEKVLIRDKTQCWKWTGADNGTGYGLVNIGYSTYLTHRVSWELFNGPIPDNKLILHKCDNRKCVNPFHLYLGTYSDNIRDMYKRGRQGDQRGENNCRAILKKKDLPILKRLREQGLSYRAIGDIFGVHKDTARNAIIGISWNDN